MRGNAAKHKSMQTNACNTIGPHPAGSALPTALQLVTALTEAHRQQLLDFAAKRMWRVRRSPGMERFLAGKTPGDLVNSALEKLLLGDTHPKKGRQLPVKNRQSLEAFLHCVRNVINSELSNAITALETTCEHLPLGDAETEPGSVEPTDPVDLPRLLERRDLEQELFRRLRQRAAPDLQPIVAHWAPRFLSEDRIASRGFDRRRVSQVRRLAREILTELAQELHSRPVRGIDLLL